MHDTVLVTGSSRGLGRSLALAFARSKYNVILHGRDRKRLEEVKKAVLENGVTCDVIIGDIESGKTIDNLAKAAAKRNLSILVNNTATYAWQSLQRMTYEGICEMINVNLIAPMLLTKAILPIFEENRKGLIININSSAGKQYDEKEAVYCASKHGLRGFSNSIRYKMATRNIRLVDIYLGAMKTDMVRHRNDFELFIEPKEVAELILKISKDYQSMRVKEVDIGRRNY